MVPPSTIAPVAVRETVVTSTVSVMVVVTGLAASLPITTFSKLPPEVEAMKLSMDPASIWASSAGAAIVAEPEVHYSTPFNIEQKMIRLPASVQAGINALVNAILENSDKQG